MSLTIVPATRAAELDEARALFLEYAAESRLDLCFQNFEAELAGLPGRYAPPSGRLLLAQAESGFAGCGAIRQLEDDGVCEMKRLFIRPAFRRRGAGKLIAVELIEQARGIGYAKMRLDTLASMLPALDLYESLGFCRIPPYYANPLPEVVYLELAL